MESKSDDADHANCDVLAAMSQEGLSHGKTVSKKLGERVVNCEVSCDW